MYCVLCMCRCMLGSLMWRILILMGDNRGVFILVCVKTNVHLLVFFIGINSDGFWRPYCMWMSNSRMTIHGAFQGTPVQGSKLRLPGYLSGKGFQSGEEGTLINTAVLKARAQAMGGTWSFTKWWFTAYKEDIQKPLHVILHVYRMCAVTTI